MNTNDTTYPRLDYPFRNPERFEYLRPARPKSEEWLPQALRLRPKPKYFFALNMYECIHVLPRLFGSIIEAIKFLGPENCVLSVVEGRSKDGTFEILHDLRTEVEKLGSRYILQTSDLNPKADGHDRIYELALLREMAVKDLVEHPSRYSRDTTVIFSNDISLCLEDILELIHQKKYQNADMTCAMDWIFPGETPLFYDVWIARTRAGDTFFHIPLNGSWDEAETLFWNDELTRSRFEQSQPFQVFACWNGITAFTAKPLMDRKVQFRGQIMGECYQGEPNYFAKDMWYHGFGKIAVVPSVNVGYFDHLSKKLKEQKGYAMDHLGMNAADAKIEWKTTPPDGVICASTWDSQEFVPWDQSLPKKSWSASRRDWSAIIDMF